MVYSRRTTPSVKCSQELRRRESDQGGRTPIIMLSANAMRQHRLDSLEAEADLHLAKPVTTISLIDAVAQVRSL